MNQTGQDSPLRHSYSKIGSRFHIEDRVDHNDRSSIESSPTRYGGHRMPRTKTLLEVQTLLKEHNSHCLDYATLRSSPSDLASIKNRAVRQYYEHLNEQLDYCQEVDKLLSESTPAVAHTLASEGSPLLPITSASNTTRTAERDRQTSIAINVNFIINIILLAGKIGVVLLSNSLSLLASAVDSAMDLLSTLIIFFTAKAAVNQDTYKYPIGKRRMEPLGVVVFAVTMITAFAQVLVESTQKFMKRDLAPVELPLSAAITMAITVIVKLAVWLAYRHFRSQSVRALSQDAMNDVVFNAFSIVFPVVSKIISWPYLDPLGAALLSIYIMKEWAETLWECVNDLIGCRAEPIQHNRVIYLATRFSPLVKAVRNVNVYTGGGGLVVEMDILLPRDISLPKAHDITESIQYALECLDGVHRAYVHADFNDMNPTGHHLR